MREDLAGQIEGIALLQDPLRRALFLYVRDAAAPVGREAAAKATRTTRENAAFHLDRLAEADLLEVSFRRLSGKTGPGAGRPAKLYRRSSRALGVTLPQRRYDLAAKLFAVAIEGRGADPTRRAAAAGRRFGVSLGRQARLNSRSAGVIPLRTVTKVLAEHGYEPVEAPRGCVRLRNCPFHALVDDHRGLVCGTNLALVKGVLAGLGSERVVAELSPQAGMCCVAIRER